MSEELNGATVLTLSVLFPIMGAVLVGICGRWPNLREAVSIVFGCVLFALVMHVLSLMSAGVQPAVVLWHVTSELRLAFAAEPLGILFALLASFLWVVTTIYSIGYMRGHNERNQTRFYVCFALAIASVMGVAFAANLFTLFLFYELLTLCTYPLVTHSGSDEAKRSGRVYLGVLLSTSIAFQLVGIVIVWRIAGTLDFTLGGVLAGKASPALTGVLCFLFAFGVGKAALMPFHFWLPRAMVAPTPVSALLHAVAVVKAGVFTILKVVVYIFGIENLAELRVGDWVTYVAAFTILTASFIAMRQDNLKARLAYSTVSQLSYIVLGAFIVNGWAVIGAGMHMVMHAFGKITLFFCAGAIMVASHKTKVSELVGLGKTMPITMTCFFVGALCVIGLPPMGGTWSKWYIALGTVESEAYVLLAVLMVSSLLNIIYLLPIPGRAFFVASNSADQTNGIDEAPVACLIAMLLTAGGCFALFFLAQPIFNLLRPLAG